MKRTFVGFVALLLGTLIFWLLYRADRDTVVPDAAKLAGKTVQDFPESDSHVFADMDSGVVLSQEEVRGRNTWLLWTAGNQTFWDGMARNGLGTGDLLKALDSRSRNTRFKEAGLINQPGLSAALKPDAYGLWIDEGPQEPGVSAAVYGRPSGVVGLRLFPNPQFDAAAAKRWNAGRYYNDRKYFEDRTLIRPYVVGMTCGFCHVSFNPEDPPADPEHPAWSNLSSTIGNQYLRARPIFGAASSDDSFPRQVLQSWPPGTIDTSFIATDHLNNPSNINPINLLASRVAVAHEETIGEGSLSLPGEARIMRVPHVLKDGADSVGLIGALSRVYVSIGEYSEEWLRDHDAILGGRPQRPFRIAQAQRGSVYWQATAAKLPNMAQFLSRMNPPRLRNALGGAAYLTSDEAVLQRGKSVFAERCALCHSSKQPANIADRNSEEYRAWLRAQVLRPDFLENNFLSTEDRIPLPVIQTNAARALATNATRNHVWDNFSSETYKQLSSAGEIEVRDATDRTTKRVALSAGGPGYYRVPSLAGIWASAPFFHNNALGTYTGDPSLQGRMRAFQDSMQKLLWPDARSDGGLIFRTSSESYLQVPESYLPWQLKWLSRDGTLRIGPIPAGTPVDLLANADLQMSLDKETVERVLLIKKLQSVLSKIQSDKLDDAAAQKLMSQLGSDLLKISKCPDFIQDRGHYFGADLTDADKRALIEFVKTF